MKLFDEFGNFVGEVSGDGMAELGILALFLIPILGIAAFLIFIVVSPVATPLFWIHEWRAARRGEEVGWGSLVFTGICLVVHVGFWIFVFGRMYELYGLGVQETINWMLDPNRQSFR